MTVAARIGHKSGALYPKPPQLNIITLLVLPPARLGHIATSPSLPSIPFLAEQAVPACALSIEKKLRVDRKKNSSQHATHYSAFGRVRVVSLDVDRDVSLYRRRIIVTTRPGKYRTNA
jgi:hypothetical protein